MKTKKITPASSFILGFILMTLMTLSMFKLVVTVKTTLDRMNDTYIAQPVSLR